MRCLICKTRDLMPDAQVCTCGVYLPSLLRDLLPIGQALNHGSYRIDDYLGRGGFGVTYAATHVRLDQPLAIKEFYPQSYAMREGVTGRLITPRNAEDDYQKWLGRFAKEGKILAKITHPHIVRVQDLFDERNTAYLVMELLEGHTLKDELAEQAGHGLAAARVVEVMTALASALAEVHQQGVYHLDLSPDNVMITHTGRIVLIDFGAARRQLGHGTLSQALSTKAFKEEYAPPELLSKSAEVSSATDIFELGMMLHELLTGKRPPTVLDRSLGAHRDWQPNLGEPWQGMLTSALQLERTERPQDVSAWWGRHRSSQNRPDPELQQRLEQLLQGLEQAKLAEQAAKLKAEQEKNAKPLILLKSYSFQTARIEQERKFLGSHQWVVKSESAQAQYYEEALGNELVLEMVSIPTGSFTMGGNANEQEQVLKDVKAQHPNTYDSVASWLKWELPSHRVKVKSFYLGKYTITQDQYESVMGSNPSKFKGFKRPVENVSWNDAKIFCERLSAKTGKEYRLPSEAEWEYACRAGTTTPFHYGETITPELANYHGNYTYGNGPKGKYRQETTQVGSFPANGWGLYDMHGNVWEWCEDVWYDNYIGAPSDGSARKDNTNKLRLLRGGSWDNNPGGCRSAARSRGNAGNRDDDVGFRVALSSLPGSS